MNAPPHVRPDSLRVVLDNGLVLLVMERPHLPIVSATLLLPAGVAHEPAEHPGISFFASQLLPVGTVHRSATALAEEVDGLGGHLSSGCDYDFATVEVSGLAATHPKLLEILADVTTNAAFLDEEVERRRSQILAILERRKDDHNDVVRSRFYQAIYGDHPYSRKKEGTEESVAAIARESLLGFYRDRYAPRGAILAIVGDVKAAEVARLVEERFGGWATAEGSEVPAIPEVAPTRTRQRIAIPDDDVTQAYIRIGNVGIARDDPSRNEIVLLNYILGGAGFGSRLMKSLREEQGLTYGAYCAFRARKRAGPFVATTQTRIETMNQAVRSMLEVIDRFREQGPTEDEMVWAKRFFTGSLPLTLETNDQLAQKLLEQEFYGLPDAFWLRDLEEMQGVSAAQVREAARRHIRPEEFAIVVLADFSKGELESEGAA